MKTSRIAPVLVLFVALLAVVNAAKAWGFPDEKKPSVGQSLPPGAVGSSKTKEPRMLSEFSRLAHGLRSGNVTIMDTRTIFIPNLHYDGTGPDAYFLVGKGRVSRRGTKVPDEKHSLEPLKRYRGESITIKLPDDLSVASFDWLAMYCIKHRHNFGQVNIPKDLDVPQASSRP